MKLYISIFLSILQVFSIKYACGNLVEIKIPQGLLKGVIKQSWLKRSFYSFTGIPYAEPPVGNLRFQPPVPLESWEGILDATKYGSNCVQNNVLMSNYNVDGNEDCLFINIYTPKLTSTPAEALSVMFYNHGGGWTSGSGSDEWYGPNFFMDENIVLVTYNYRLGPLGFFSTGDEVVPGNNGLKDQALALKWTKDNAQYFGGNPNKITIFGNSAGGGSTHYHLFSPLTRDLFHGAIIQSGTAFGPWALASKEYSENSKNQLAKLLNCPTASSRDLVNCLRGKSASEITKTSSRIYKWASYDPVVIFRPVIEDNIKGAYLIEKPEVTAKLGKVANVPIILSITSEDGFIRSGHIYNSSMEQEFNDNFVNIAPYAILYFENNNQQQISNSIKKFYFKNKRIDRTTVNELTNVFTDSWFLYPLSVAVSTHNKFAHQPVYAFLYAYRGINSYGEIYGDPSFKEVVCHSDELLYLFTTRQFGVYHNSDIEKKVVRNLITLWTNFAKFGNPTPDEHNELPKWELAKGFLEFLCTGDSEAPGNIRLKDQNSAVKWIQSNIIYFGGNPNNIIMFGQSAGAHTIHLHMVSPLSRNLIKGAINTKRSVLTHILFNSPVDLLAPVSESSWEGVLYATKQHAVCPQMNVYVGDFNITGDEDCLYLNVYTPEIKSSGNGGLPVMFYIHGGGWMCGSANIYGPEVLLDQDVVLVTINYRLGALGFLTTGDSIVPGNNGLKDQNMALKWVKKNIASFGGDPNSITVFGQSAGGASAHYHMLSPLSKDLISRVIVQSGSALAPWALGLPSLALNNTKNLANFVNCSYASSQVLVDCLKKLSAYEIVAQDLKYLEWSYHPMIPFKPVIEEECDDAFLTDEPANIIKLNNVAKVPMIIGFTSEDGAFKTAYLFKQSKLINELNRNFNRIAPFLLVYHESTSHQDEISEKVQQLYFGDRKIDQDSKTAFTDMITDSWFHLPADHTVNLHTQYTNENVYYYLFSYRGSNSYINLFKSADDNFNYGACHGDDLLYLFNIESFPDYKPNLKDKLMNEMITSIWANFAKTGNPTPNNTGNVVSLWTPVKTKNHEFYWIKNDKEIKMRSNLNLERMEIWKGVIFNDRWKKIKDEL
ncbi:hypothetical protein FQR65_LT06593 [Abscondita terminalis]|nr:hypothetical protein FQR65_LT06593 [Abscondita terminalis]